MASKVEDLRKLKDAATKAIEKQKYDKAGEIYLEIAAREPDPDWHQRAGDAFRRVDDPRAIPELTAAADGYARGGFLLKAIAVCKVILQIDPKHTEVQARLAGLYSRRDGTPPPPPKPATLQPPPVIEPAAPAPPPQRAQPPVLQPPPKVQPPVLQPPPKVQPPVLQPPPREIPLAAESLPVPFPVAQDAVVSPLLPRISPPPSRRSSIRSPRRARMRRWMRCRSSKCSAAVARRRSPSPRSRRSATEEDQPGVYEISLDEDAGIAIDVSEDAESIALADTTHDESIAVEVAPEPPPAVSDEMDFGSLNDDAPAKPAARAETDFGGLDDEPVAPPAPPPAALPKIPLFSSLGVDDLRFFIERMSLSTPVAGETIVRQGDRGGSLYVIADGEARDARRQSRDRALGPRQLLPERSASCTERAAHLRPSQRRTPPASSRVSRELLWEVTRRSPEVLRTLLRFLRDRLLERLLGRSALFGALSPDDARALASQFVFLEIEAGTSRRSRPANAPKASTCSSPAPPRQCSTARCSARSSPATCSARCHCSCARPRRRTSAR